MRQELPPAQSAPEERYRSVADPELYRHSLIVQSAIIRKLGDGDAEAGMLIWNKEDGSDKNSQLSEKFRERLDADHDGGFAELVMREDVDAIIEALKRRD